MEAEMKIEDISEWHHLIFVEELADDVSDKANCSLCREQAVGGVYKCLECDFIQHKSCPTPTRENWERTKNHKYDSRHHLMLVEEEEVENKDEEEEEEEVVCLGCQEPPSLPAYKCAIPGCSFLLHKCCADLSSQAIIHPQHSSDHLLTLQPIYFWSRGRRGKGDKRCNGCNKVIERWCLYYGCRRCNVYLHPNCSAPHIQLKLEPQPEPRQDLSPWHHLVFVEELAFYKDEWCSLCYEQAVGPVYICLELGCGFIMHQSCPNPTKKYWEDDMKNHSYNEARRHHLMLVEEEEEDEEEKKEVVCWVCQEIIASLSAYKCAIPGCTFFLHKSCTEVSHAVLHPLHSDHVLTLQPNEENCTVCFKHKKSLCYGCVTCGVSLHNARS